MRCVWILVLLAFVSTQARFTSQESSEEENVILSDSSLGSSESDDFRFKRDVNAMQGYMNDDAAVTVDENGNESDGDSTTRGPPRRRGGSRRHGHRGSGIRRPRCRPGDNSRRCSRTRRPSPPPTDAPIADTIV
ncbi:unnamed protein product [Lymnaea stagnalis]|uniref:Uncharacterized protein n=1 Tax=Lymnaea stagnalis TaxID=6523 RepID=A0AAV2IB86_LYMST